MYSELTRLDHALAALVSKIPAGLMPLMTAVTFIGQPIIVIAVALIAGVIAWFKDARQITYAEAAALVAFSGNTVIKHLVHRNRPHTMYVGDMRIKSYSFPSGHAFGSTVVYGLLAYLAFKYLPHPWNIIIMIVLIILILLVGVSRVYLGAHFPSDVIAGWVLGGVSLLIIIRYLRP